MSQIADRLVEMDRARAGRDPHKEYMADWDEIKILEAQLGIDCVAVYRGQVPADTPLLQACLAYSQAHADTPLLSGRFELECIKAGRPYLELLRSEAHQ